ncbi:ABC transporter permease [Chryseobacterium arachidis]|uniref:ABC transporter permease n=1 Tax=Chryseobacterium arachidis TaxID=1416778 RepID=UPI003619D7B5
MSVGLCVFLLIFIHWQDEKSYEQWNPDRENIYLVENFNASFGTMPVSSYPEIFESKEMFSEIEDATIFNDWGKKKISFGNNSAYVSAGATVSSFFNFFPFEKVAGSFKNALSDVNKVALSEETAKLLFADDYLNSIGKTVKLEVDDKSYIVTAVYKKPLGKTVIKPDFVFMNPFMENSKTQWTSYSYYGFFKIKPGSDIKVLEEKISKKNAVRR